MKIPDSDRDHPILYLPPVIQAFEQYLDDALINRSNAFLPSFRGTRFTAILPIVEQNNNNTT
jgi:hypothetical protein